VYMYVCIYIYIYIYVYIQENVFCEGTVKSIDMKCRYM